jgi:quercetin dioxygenase-like cupin family protein
MSAKKISRSPRVAQSLGGDAFPAAAPADPAMLLALAAPPVRAPSPAVKEALLARLRLEWADKAPVPAGWRFTRIASADGWVKLPLPGVRLRELAVDAPRDTAMLLVEMAAGAVFPDHDHSATERGLVLSGDLNMDGRLLRAGDFYEAAAGTRHERVASPSGCTGLLWVGAKAWQRWRELAGAR